MSDTNEVVEVTEEYLQELEIEAEAAGRFKNLLVRVLDKMAEMGLIQPYTPHIKQQILSGKRDLDV